MSALLQAEKLALIRGRRRLFKGLSVTLHGGCALHIAGANGSGKTSLLRVLAGLLAADEGAIKVNGDVLYLGHQTAVKPTLTVAENLRFSSVLFDQTAVTEQQLSAALSTLDLQRFADYACGKLSAGQQRRVMLARLWLSNKAIWLLDEPLTALDSHSSIAVQQRINTHLAQGGGVIFASHQTLALNYPVISVDLGAA